MKQNVLWVHKVESKNEFKNLGITNLTEANNKSNQVFLQS